MAGDSHPQTTSANQEGLPSPNNSAGDQPTVVATPSHQQATVELAGLLSQSRERARFAEHAAQRSEVARSSAASIVEQLQTILSAAQGLESAIAAVVQAAAAAKESAEASLRSSEEARIKTQDESVAAAAARTEAQTNASAAQQAAQAAQASLAQAGEHQQAAQSSATSAATALADTQQQLASATESAQKIAGLLQTAMTDQAKTKGLADKADKTEAALRDYEASLSHLQGDYAATKIQIEGLLPGATSAGLAHHFREQKDSYFWPKIFWASLFVAAVIGMMATVWLAPEEQWIKNIVNPYQGLLVSFLHRSPYFIPLGLLAYFAYRYYGLADRMQQDYAYKERLSSAFEGYKKQMGELQVPDGQVSPFAGLCNNILHIIGQHPARFYDKNHVEEAPPALSVGQLLDGHSPQKPKSKVQAATPNRAIVRERQEVETTPDQT